MYQVTDRKFCSICKTYSHIPLIKFPVDPSLRSIWSKKTGIKPKNDTDNTTRICHVHFTNDDWMCRLGNEGKVIRTLKSDAVPSQYIAEFAPVPDPECSVPKQQKKSNVRCAVCNIQCKVSDAVAIFEKDHYYTDFGVALSSILKLSSRALLSRYVCSVCSEAVVRCFESMVDINVSTMLATRMQQIKLDLANGDKRKELFDAYDGIELEELQSTIRCHIRQLKKLAFGGRCFKCDGIFSTIEKFTDHFLTHIFIENREIFNKTVAMTQTNEFEMDMGVSDEFEDPDGNEPYEVRKPRRKREKRKTPRETAEEIDNDDGENIFEVEYLEDEFFENVEILESAIDSSSTSVQAKLIYDFDVDHNQIETIDMYNADLGDTPIEVLSENDCLQTFDNKLSLALLDATAISEQNSAPPIGDESHIKLDTPDKRTRGRRKKKKQAGTDTGERVCHVCGAILKHVKSYLVHMSLHDNPRKNFKRCENCGRTVGNLSQHRKTCARQLERMNTVKERKGPTVMCGVCGKSFNEKYLNKHLLMHEIDAEIARDGPAALEKFVKSCDLCGKRVKHLNYHMVKSHNIKKMRSKDLGISNNPTTYECDHCGANYIQRPMFIIHLVLKHGLDPRFLNARGFKTQWTCSVCNQVFMGYTRMRKHTKDAHHGIGLDLSCELCDRHYNCLRSLRSHIYIKHINYFKYHCSPCDMYFVKQISYQDHLAFRCRANLAIRKKTRKGAESGKRKKIEKIFLPFTETVIADEEVFYITDE